MDNTKRTYWIDVAKFMAIIGVMIDHTNGLLYKSQKIAYFSYYSVSLFILMMGVTSYWSYSRYNESIINKVGKSCWKIIRPYLVASFIYSIFSDRQFHFGNYLTRVTHFNASGPFYYVLLYLQLLFLVPVLYLILKYADRFKYGVAVEIIGLIVVLFISSLTTNYSNILDIYGGGGKLFGATYLILLYLGMLFGKHYRKLSVNNIMLVILFIVSITLTVLWLNFIYVDKCQIDTYVPYGEGFSPASISFGLYAILMACTIFLLEKVLNFNTHLIKVFEIISVLGRHTLYMFLYHRIILGILARTGIIISNIWVMRIVYFTCMIGGSIIIEIVLEKIHVILKRAYFPKYNSVYTQRSKLFH